LGVLVGQDDQWGEALAESQRRVMADPIAASTGFVVFGGLPD
jgi:hypothetical protein